MARGCFHNKLKVLGISVLGYWRYIEFRDIDPTR